MRTGTGLVRDIARLTLHFLSLFFWIERLKPRSKQVVGCVGNQQVAIQASVARPEPGARQMFRAVNAVKHDVSTAGPRPLSDFVALRPRPEAYVEHDVNAKFKTSWPEQTDLVGDFAGIRCE